MHDIQATGFALLHQSMEQQRGHNTTKSKSKIFTVVQSKTPERRFTEGCS